MPGRRPAAVAVRIDVENNSVVRIGDLDDSNRNGDGATNNELLFSERTYDSQNPPLVSVTRIDDDDDPETANDRIPEETSNSTQTSQQQQQAPAIVPIEVTPIVHQSSPEESANGGSSNNINDKNRRNKVILASVAVIFLISAVRGIRIGRRSVTSSATTASPTPTHQQPPLEAPTPTPPNPWTQIGQTMTAQGTIENHIENYNDHNAMFGFSVALADEDLMKIVIGAPRHTFSSEGPGHVVLTEYDNDADYWQTNFVVEGEITPDGTVDESLGYSVATDHRGDIVAAGVGGGIGIVQVGEFSNNGIWTITGEFECTPPDDPYFATSCRVTLDNNGNTIVISSLSQDKTSSFGETNGLVRVYTRTGTGIWTPMGSDIIIPSGKREQEKIPRIAIKGYSPDVLVVGDPETGPGRIIIYQFLSPGDWIRVAEFQGDRLGDNFGGEIAMDEWGSTVAASSSHGGYVDIFKTHGSNGEQWQKFTRINQPKYTSSPIWSFPVSLSFNGDIVAIGDPSYNIRYGRVQVYWLVDCASSEDEKTLQIGSDIVPGSISDDDRWAMFGSSLALSEYGRYVVVGAPNWSGNKGSVSVFQRY